MIAFRYLLCIGSWGTASVALEYEVKIGLGREAAFIADLRQGHVGGHQQVHGLFDPLLLDVFVGSLPGGGLKQIVEINGAEIGTVCQKRKRKLRGKIFPDVPNGILDDHMMIVLDGVIGSGQGSALLQLIHQRKHQTVSQ